MNPFPYTLSKRTPKKRRQAVSPRSLFILVLALLGVLSVHVRPSDAFDVQLMGNFDVLPISPLQNAGSVGVGGGARFTWEYLPDWDITATLMTNIFQTSTTIAQNPVTYETNTSGLMSITPLTFGVYHILYRTKSKNWIYALADIGAGFEYSYGSGRITPEPFGEAGAGFSFKQWFIEERVAGMPLAFPAYPSPTSPSGPLLFLTTSVGVHFFVF